MIEMCTCVLTTVVLYMYILHALTSLCSVENVALGCGVEVVGIIMYIRFIAISALSN